MANTFITSYDTFLRTYFFWQQKIAEICRFRVFFAQISQETVFAEAPIYVYISQLQSGYKMLSLH